MDISLVELFLHTWSKGNKKLAYLPWGFNFVTWHQVKTFIQQIDWTWKSDEDWPHVIIFVKWEVCIIQLRIGLKTLANTKNNISTIQVFFGKLNYWFPSFNFVSFNFIPGDLELHFWNLGDIHKTILCYQNFSEKKGLAKNTIFPFKRLIDLCRGKLLNLNTSSLKKWNEFTKM